jgi:hypothetical protein
MTTLPPNIPSAVGASVLHDYLMRLNSWLYTSLQSKLTMNTAVNGILLQSPGGKVYNITVTDAGAVTATLVTLGSHP